MKIDSFIPLLLLSSVCWKAAAGTITGTVRAEGKDGPTLQLTPAQYESRKFKFAERMDYTAMRDFVVFIDGPVTTNTASADKPIQVLTTRSVNQKGAQFTPRVLPVMTGTTVEWPNNDDIFHNVFSMSEAKPFDLGLYKHPEVKRVTFDKPGRVDVFCSIHANMNCIILVLENRWFASTDERGRYAITNVPPGMYRLKAWHDRLPPHVQEVSMPEAGEVKLDFVLGVKNLPKY